MDNITNILPTLNQEKQLLLEGYLRSQGATYGTFNMVLALELTGDLDKRTLASAVNGLIAKHELLRAAFHRSPTLQADEYHLRELLFAHTGTCHHGVFRYSIRDHQAVTIRESPVTLAVSEKDAEVVEDMARQEFSTRFDYSAPPLLRASLILFPLKSVLLLTVPHLIADRVSLGVLKDDLAAIYKSMKVDGRETCDDSKAPFAKFSNWQHRHLLSDRSRPATEYWADKWRAVGDDANPLRPMIIRRPPTESGYRLLSRVLTVDQTSDLRARSIMNKVTLYMSLLGSLASALQVTTGRRGIAIWVNLSNRVFPDAEAMCGWFVNSHIVSVTTAPGATARENLTDVQAEVINAIRYQEIPTTHVWKTFGRAPSQAFDIGSVQFDYFQTSTKPHEELERSCGVRLIRRRPVNGPRRPVRTLDAIAVEQDGQLQLSLSFDASVIGSQGMAGLLDHWVRNLFAM